MNKSPCVGSGLTLWIPATACEMMVRWLAGSDGNRDFPARLALESCRRWVRNESDHPRSTAICPSCVVLKSPWHAVMNKKDCNCNALCCNCKISVQCDLYHIERCDMWTYEQFEPGIMRRNSLLVYLSSYHVQQVPSLIKMRQKKNCKMAVVW